MRRFARLLSAAALTAVLATPATAADEPAFGHPGGEPDYSLEAVRQGFRAVPRLTRSGLPPSLPFIREVAPRKRIFLKSVLPAILQANEHVRELRGFVRTAHNLDLNDNYFPGVWQARLRVLAERYHVAPGDTGALLRRIDTLPPSLMLAQAALETGWGTSRFAHLGNALFGQHVTDPAIPGMIPGGFDETPDFRVRAFPTLTRAVAAYLRNINTTRAYAGLRAARAEARQADRPLDGLALAGQLTAYSVRGRDYVRDVRVTIRANDLRDFDDAGLMPAPSRDAPAYVCLGTSQASNAAC